jgi:tRNA A37 threonylcarbamoyladenosine modification protein TsaB
VRSPGGAVRRIAGPEVSRAADIPGRDVPVAGQGALLYPDALAGGPASAAGMPIYPAAGDMCDIVVAALAAGQPDTLLPLEPLYLRRPDAREPGAPKRVSQS